MALAPAALPHTVATRAARRRRFDATLALADYRAPLDAAARGLKFHRQLALGTEFAARLARLIDDTPGAGGSTWRRPCRCRTGGSLRAATTRRGRSRVRARRLGVRADAVLLARVADTAPQSRLDRHARRDNVMAAFAVAGGVAGRHVALVDDVMTSGATLAPPRMH